MVRCVPRFFKIGRMATKIPIMEKKVFLKTSVLSGDKADFDLDKHIKAMLADWFAANCPEDPCVDNPFATLIARFVALEERVTALE